MRRTHHHRTWCGGTPESKTDFSWRLKGSKLVVELHR